MRCSQYFDARIVAYAVLDQLLDRWATAAMAFHHRSCAGIVVVIKTSRV